MKRAGALKIGDVVSHDPAYGTAAEVTMVSSPRASEWIEIGFRNLYNGFEYKCAVDGMRLFELKEPAAGDANAD